MHCHDSNDSEAIRQVVSSFHCDVINIGVEGFRETAIENMTSPVVSVPYD